MIRRRFGQRASSLLLLYSILFLNYCSEKTSAATVTLYSIEIFNTHEWLPTTKPIVYFKCKGEEIKVLPDVTEKHVNYTFRVEESWQPLTELQNTKCKRCGFYEKDTLKSDDVFDEWEFCASDFTRSDGEYIHFKDKELNATFLCPECVPLASATNDSSKSRTRSKGLHWAVILVICVAVSALLVIGLIGAHNYLKNRRRQQEQARFLKLFEEADDVEDELGIAPLSHVV